MQIPEILLLPKSDLNPKSRFSEQLNGKNKRTASSDLPSLSIQYGCHIYYYFSEVKCFHTLHRSRFSLLLTTAEQTITFISIKLTI